MNEVILFRPSTRSTLSPVLFIFLITLGSFGCHSSHPHQDELDELRSLESSVLGAFAQVQNLPTDSVLASARWASQNLQELELLLSGNRIEITKAEGAIISEVSRARRLLKDHATRRNRLSKNTERTQLQIKLLADAIAQHARFDGAGTAIDSSYIAQQLKTETRVANELIAALLETVDLAHRGMNLVEGARSDNDSLQKVLRARLAQFILEDSNESTLQDP